MLKRIVALVSGGGTNLQALINAQKDSKIKNGFICCVISSNSQAYALERAKQAKIPTVVLPRNEYASRAAYDAAVLETLRAQQADLIVLAGFMFVLGEEVIRAYERRIINVHPSLIPAFCGDGFYGLRVHQAALDYGVKVTGATVHFVNEITDGGEIILQKAVAVEEGDNPEKLQKRVMEQAEWELLWRAVSLFCEGKLDRKDEAK